MRLTNPMEFIIVGSRIRYLTGRSEGETIHGKDFILSNMQRFKADLERMDFAVSRNLYLAEIQPLEDEFAALEELVADEPASGVLTHELATKLTSVFLDLEKTVFAEARTRIVATPVPRRFALDHLLQSPGSILGTGVFQRLPAIAQIDLSEACRCIAFECPTAATFHVLRCVEECTRQLYKAYFRRGDERRGWGLLTAELRKKKRAPKPDPTMLDHLDHLRTRFRNPTDHPEKVYEIEETEDLVHLAVDIINRCIRDPRVAAARKE
jgi:hypothetical protein